MPLADHLDKLRSFATIVEAGTLREAAEKLHVTQPSLTRLIQTLEEAAGVPLLARGRSGVQATEAGRLLLAFAQDSLKKLEDLEARLTQPADQLSGHLRVGSYESLAEYLWPEFIADFRRQLPQLRVGVRTSNAGSHLLALEAGQLDLLVDAEPRLVGDFISWPLYEDRFAFYSAEKGLELSPAGLGDLPLVYCPLAFDRENKRILTHLEEAGYYFREKIELDSFPSVMAFAKQGVGLSVLPTRLAAAAVKARELHPAALKGFSAKGFGSHSLAATISAHRKDDPRLRHLIQALRKWFKD